MLPSIIGGARESLQTFTSMAEKTLSDEELDFVRIMRTADAIARYALSPPVVADYLAEGGELRADRLDRDLHKGPNHPMRRFQRLCAAVAAMSFADATAWTNALWEHAKEGPTTPLAPTKRSVWSLWSRMPVRYSRRPSKELPLIPNMIRSYCGNKISLEQAFSTWKNYGQLFRSSPALDRYSQCCPSGGRSCAAPYPLKGIKRRTFLTSLG